MTDRTPPRARTTDLIVETLADETLVFDRRSDTAHCLSPVAALVWQHCDGKTSVQDLVDLVAALGEESPDLLVDRALDDLQERRLLQEGVSRRVALNRMVAVGATAFAVPLIISVKAPTAAQAQTLVATYHVCTESGSGGGVGCASPDDICTKGINGDGTEKYCNPDKNCGGHTAVCTQNSGCCSNACLNGHCVTG